MTASLLSGAFLFLVLARSEMRRMLLGEPAALLAATAVVWVVSYVVSRRVGGDRQRKERGGSE